MVCEFCGAELERPGQGHSCVSQRPVPPELPAQWVKARRRVVFYALAYVILVVALNLIAVTTTGASDATQLGRTLLLLLVSLIGLACVFGTIVSIVFWVWGAHRLTPYGPGPFGYAGLAGFVLLVVLSYLVPAGDSRIILSGVLRLAAPIILIIGVLASRGWVARRVSTAHRQAMDAATSRRMTPSDEDWDSSRWDPGLEREIERRREDGPPTW